LLSKKISVETWKQQHNKQVKMMTTYLKTALVVSLVSAHSRWRCPLPRDWLDENGTHIVFDNTGNKYGACGPMSGSENWVLT
jgi:hypothetical protein